MKENRKLVKKYYHPMHIIKITVALVIDSWVLSESYFAFENDSSSLYLAILVILAFSLCNELFLYIRIVLLFYKNSKNIMISN